MDPPQHRLSAIDSIRRTAVCASCGPTRIHTSTNGQGKPGWRCAGRSRYRRRADDSYTLGRKRQALDDQGGMCGVCGIPLTIETAMLDHDHVSGKIRGALCRRCNIGLGYFRDDPVLVAHAAAYLTK